MLVVYEPRGHKRLGRALNVRGRVFYRSRKICLLLRVFMYMRDLYDCLKRKTRTSDSDSETKSPEGKRVCNELTVVDDIRDDTITDSNQEAQELVASSNMEDITKQLKLILCKLQ